MLRKHFKVYRVTAVADIDFDVDMHSENFWSRYVDGGGAARFKELAVKMAVEGDDLLVFFVAEEHYVAVEAQGINCRYHKHLGAEEALDEDNKETA